MRQHSNTCGLSFTVVAVKLPTKMTVFSSQMQRSSNIIFVSLDSVAIVNYSSKPTDNGNEK